MRPAWRVPILYAAVTLVMLALPLVNVLHAESCAALAFVGFFGAGLDAVRRFRQDERFLPVLAAEMAWLLVPFALFQLARLFAPGCDFLAGARYFVLFPCLSVVLAVSLAFFLTSSPRRRANLKFVLIGVCILIGGLVWDLGFHPQFYTYNHVFGAVLGPIYDLHQASRSGLYAFRGLTLLWSTLLVLAAVVRRGNRSPFVFVALFVSSALVATAYVFADGLGINSSERSIADGLGSAVQTEHFVIHYDNRVVGESDLTRLIDDHEFRYYQMREALGYDVDEPIHSYIYPTARVRAELTGAGFTNVAPVWLGKPQLHVLFDDYDRSFSHELAHVFSRDLGLPVIHASLRVGLVEGFAVAMEPPIGLPSPTDQVAAIRNAPDFDSLYGGQSLAAAIEASLSPTGFWSGRGAVSYTTMGSFVRFLLDAYGPTPFRKVYGMESFEEAYGIGVRELAAQWEASLLGRKLPPEVEALAAGRFSILSIFERRCPHDTPRAVERYWDAQDWMTLRDTTSARAAVTDVLELQPDFVPALALWATLALSERKYDEVIERVESITYADSTATVYLGVPLGDALAMSGNAAAAESTYARAVTQQSPFARSTRAILAARGVVSEREEIVAAANDVGGRAAARTLLSHSDVAAGRFLGAIAAAMDGDYESAYELMRSTEGSEFVDVIGTRWFAWTSSFAYRLGLFEEAERFRRLAVQLAQEENDRYERQRLEDFGDRIQWVMRSKEL